MARKTNKRVTRQQRELQARLINSDVSALYIRVSTDKQAEEGFSLDEQEERLRAFCFAQGWTVDEEHIYIDAGETGTKTDNRAAFNQMMKSAIAGDIGRIVATKLDRIARNTKDFLHVVDTLDGHGCDLVLIKESFDTATPQGKFAITMFAAIAELEASTITERVMSGKAQKATQGGYNGSPVPFGYNYDGSTFSKNEDSEIVAFIFEAFINRGLGLTKIANELNDSNTKTARGGKFYPATVRYILMNGFYAGLTQWDDGETVGTHPAIISKSMYEEAYTKIKSSRPGPRRK